MLPLAQSPGYAVRLELESGWVGRVSRPLPCVATGEIGKGHIMKVQDFAYQVASRTIGLLEETQHYKVPDELRKSVLGKIQEEIDDLIKKSK